MTNDPSPKSDEFIPTEAMVGCLQTILWAQKHEPGEVDVFWEDLAIMVNDYHEKSRKNKA